VGAAARSSRKDFRVTRIGTGARLALAVLLMMMSGCGNAAQEHGATPPSPASASEVAATVDGEAITTGELEESIAASLAKLHEQEYELKKERLDALIADRLLAAEAKRRGVTVKALLDQEVTAKVQPVTDEQIESFVAANRSRIQGDPARLTERIRTFLSDQQESTRREALVDALRKKSTVDVRLSPPPVFRAHVATDGFPSRGPASAPVTIVEFSDFHCPFCRAAQPTLDALLARYPGQLRLVYRHFPLDSLHPQARRAAEAAWCAAQQDKFWPFHDELYKSGPETGPDTLSRLATEAGLDKGRFDQCLASGKAGPAVEADVEEGTKFGVTGTPGFFINGRALSGNQPIDAFVSVIDEELKSSR
jgi:protein-disulfide isomerase